MTNYAGNPLVYPASYPRLSDATPPTGSQINVPLETNADRTAFLARVIRQLGASNWGPKVTPAFSASLAIWDSFKRRWWIASDGSGGGGGKIFFSYDSGQTFDPTYVAVTGISTNAQPVVGDFDAAGNGVIGRSGSVSGFTTHDDNAIWEYSYSTGAWTQRNTIPGLGVDGVATGCHYDPVHAKWCVTQLKLSGTPIVATTSTDRVTWVASTMPASLASGFGAACSAIRKDTGRIVVVGNRTTDSKIYFAASDDGGATFTDLVSFARPGNIAVFSLVYATVLGAWVCTMRSTTGSTYTYTSTNDGATWTLVSTLANNRIQSIVAIEGVLIGYASDSSSNQYPVFSDDAGATWHPAYHLFAASGSGWGVFSGGGQVLALTGANVFPSRRFGGSGEVLT